MRRYGLQRPHQVVVFLASVLALAGCLSCGGKGDAGKQGFSRCIEDWPSANGPHPTKPSLNVEAPKVVWRTEVPWTSTAAGPYDIGPVISQDRIAFPTTNYVFFVGKDGSNPQKVAYNALGEPPSGLVADLDGNIYYVTQGGVYSVDATGNLRWQRPLGGSGSGGEYARSYPPVLGPDGVVYAVTSSLNVVALRASDGSTIWSQPAPGSQSPSRVLGGAGRGLFLFKNGQQVDVLDTVSGDPIGTLRATVNGRESVFSSPVLALGWSPTIEAGWTFVFDSCGRMRWSTYDESRSTIWGLNLHTPGEKIVAAGSGDSNGQWVKTELRLYDMEGKVTASNGPYAGEVRAVGADGTIYTVEGRDILAYSLELREFWRLDIGGSGGPITGTVVLDDDGMMYLMHQAESGGTELVGIQTRSPGLADSSWPSIRHDNRGTAWLVPGVPSTTTPTP